MNPGLYIAFLISAAALILLPGPTVLVVTTKSLRCGIESGLIAVAGSTLAAACQLVLVVAGLASVVVFASNWFDWVRWVGAAYLIYLGVKAWSASASDGSGEACISAVTSWYRHFADGFVVTLTNPKTLLFLGAFLPQFLDPTIPALPQLLVLAASFLVVAAVLDSCWALLAARLGMILSGSRSRKVVDRVSGSVLVGAGAMLALARRSQ